ncbi:putative TIR domain, P-loop containing nucleoside triphosphate hydrolase [Helianthus annuus]|nr:putative TIR domain, P-loop containing nucleoside triphosphate hydrolase [Helianthus annuus]KAJ0809860.1 putative TIR domain, P-loop containing nucleoside triphosphate hydrolase [Helianthus annuus]
MVVLTEHEVLPGSSSSSSTPDHIHRYDVFLSFRGADTRKHFTAHLYEALVEANYDTFLDDEEIETGEPLKPELESAIQSSRASVIVMSKNYASSTWCLDELVLILQQQKKFNQFVIPIFYDVEPTHVRKQQQSFGEAIAKHKKRMEEETDVEKRRERAQKIESWRMALTEVAGLKGKDAKDKNETEFIEDVVADIRRRLVAPLRDTPSLLIGVDHYINVITSWLKDGSCHTADILTIVGIGGIGKTSLAKCVFQLHSSKFHKSSFIEGINTRCNDHSYELPNLQKQLHKVISKRTPLQVDDVSKKVFIVLDDIGNLKQLDDLLGNKGLYPGSKIIVTAKDSSFTEKCSLNNPQVQPNHRKIVLNGLGKYESLELLCIHAFNSHMPEEGYENVSKELAEYCDGHPLALQLLGRSLQKEDVRYWKDCIKVLNKEPHPDIKNVLRMSFDSLSFGNDKELFKHIACFFVGMDRDLTKTILEACDIKTTHGMKNLINRCLLSIGLENELMMHSLIQEMGRDLVCQEYPEKPWKRSRLWRHEESFKVMKMKKDKGNLLGLALDMKMLDEKKFNGSFELKTNSLSNMDNLLLLQLNYVQLNDSFPNFPDELRWLCMHGFPLKAIHLNKPMENLVALDMSYSNIESFDPQPPAKKQKLVGSFSKEEPLLGSLKILNLSFCKQLHSVGGFFELPALEKLIVSNCRSLIEVCESVEQCVELVHIDLSYCYKLKKLPIGKLQKVQTLLLNGCNLSESAIMDSSDVSISSQTSSSAIIREAMPSDFKFFMTFLPSSLRILSLTNNKLSNKSFPMDLSCLAMLEELCLNENPIVSLPICVGTLPRIQKLSIDECYDVISVGHLPRTLREFSMFTYDESAKIRIIKFDPEMPPLKLEALPGWAASHLPVEIEGIIKIEPMEDVEEKLLNSLGWKKSDFIKEGHLEAHDIQMMLYEFGIFSTIYWGKGMPEWIRYRSWDLSISFIIPSSPKKLRGLNFCCVNWLPFTCDCFSMPKIKISNITKKQTWIYDHYTSVRGKDCYSWLSHWMFGPNEMKAGDDIIIQIKCSYKLECGVGVVYDDGSMEEDEVDELSYYKSWNHIIGGDLSAFQLTTGEYYLHSYQFTRHSIEAFHVPFIGYKSSYKEKEVIFKAFSIKKSEIVGSQAQCSQTRPTATPPAGAPCMPTFPYGLGQQTFDGQPQLTLIPTQPGLGHQHQLVPGMSSPMANFCMPMVPTCQQEAGGSRVSVPGPQNHQQPLSLMQQQMVPFGLMYSHPPGSDTGNALMASVPYDVEKAMHLRDAGGIFALTNASPTEQRIMPGEDQYPPLEQLEAESEAAVTRDFLR